MSTSYTLNNPSYTYGNLTASGTYAAGTGITYADDAWVTTASTNAVWNNPSPTLQLNGKDADIVINGQSLNKTLQEIKDQLLIPTVINRNPKLEEEFTELKQLGEEYQNKLKHYQEQKRIFNILKTQDQ